MSGKAIPLRTDYTAVDCRRLARSCKNAREICRLLAIAAVYDGMNRGEAAKVGGMDRQTLRDHCPAGYAKHAREEGCIASTIMDRMAFLTVGAPGQNADFRTNSLKHCARS